MTESAGIGTLIALMLLIAASVYLGMMARRVVRQSSFMQSYFLGNRALGTWALALTATVQSGGTFMGFPSYVYSFGWIVALWIAGYMVVPLSGFGVLAKRLAHLSRRTGALTVPDLFRERFNSPTLGLVASLLILIFMSFMMVAQFKAGALIIKICWPGSGALDLVEHDQTLDRYYYYLGLAIFTVTVVGYTLIGGFLAAVWTDLFQSILMLVGVLVLLPLTLLAVGGLENASRSLQYEVSFKSVSEKELAENRARRELAEARLRDVDTALREYAKAHGGRLPDRLDDRTGSPFLASDPVTGKPLAYYGQGRQLSPPGAVRRTLLALTPADEKGWRSCLYSNGIIRSGVTSEPGSLSTGPGPFEWHPLGMAVSFFFLWVLNGLASPAGMVRVMAAKGTETIRRSIYVLATYNALIYLPLVIICVCGRVLIPDLPSQNSDEIIPRLALQTTAPLWGGSLIAGLILAAPFGAVMATVSSYLVVIASGIVRDIYQRFINPQVGVREIRRLSYISMVVVGLVAVAANLRPVEYLQAIVVFSGSCGAAAFLMPALMAAYWRRATASGALAAMLSGTGVMLLLNAVGWWVSGKFSPYLLFGMEPVIWGVLVSVVAGVSVSLVTRTPDAKHLAVCFDAENH